MGVYRRQAQLKVRDLAVAHPSGVTSARIDTPMHYCSWGAGGRLVRSRLRGAGARPAKARGRRTGKYSLRSLGGRDRLFGWHQGRRELAF